uniref:non-specific serine/threonine protein kinase n=1 Tax=Lactuca sativa TaxID=4236 RepID=A0A9R1VF49_LACSA|nr:hypothetical protein LSAT_V11C500249580 [Lactuca sativa]
MWMKVRWPTRKNIIQMVVKGLTYHYKDLNKQVIHRDLKASNIFLDQNMNAKIFDFGLAKFLNLNETEHRQKHWMGHKYITSRTFSTKYDIFSFGVLMLEIVNGISVVSTSFPENTSRSIVDYDPLLQDKDVDDEVMRIIDISYLCLQQKPEDRPKTSTILQLLTIDVLVPEPIFLSNYQSSYHSVSQGGLKDFTRMVPPLREVDLTSLVKKTRKLNMKQHCKLLRY